MVFILFFNLCATFAHLALDSDCMCVADVFFSRIQYILTGQSRIWCVFFFSSLIPLWFRVFIWLKLYFNSELKKSWHVQYRQRERFKKHAQQNSYDKQIYNNVIIKQPAVSNQISAIFFSFFLSCFFIWFIRSDFIDEIQRGNGQEIAINYN